MKMIRLTGAAVLAAFSCLHRRVRSLHIALHRMPFAASASHAPSQEALAQIPWQDILKTLETGP